MSTSGVYGPELSSHSPSTIITDPNPNRIQACYSVLPKHIEGLSYAHTTLDTGLGAQEYIIEECNITVFETLMEEMDTCTVHSTNTKQENHCSIDETNYMQNASGRD